MCVINAGISPSSGKILIDGVLHKCGRGLTDETWCAVLGPSFPF